MDKTLHFFFLNIIPEIFEFCNILGCERDIGFWYRPMMQAGLVSPDFGARFCHHYGICQNTQKLDLDTNECNRCIQGYNYLNVLLTSSFGIGETITYLSGPTFCSQPEYLAQDLAGNCTEFLMEFLPLSLPASASQVTIYAPDLCSILFDLC